MQAYVDKLPNPLLGEPRLEARLRVHIDDLVNLLFIESDKDLYKRIMAGKDPHSLYPPKALWVRIPRIRKRIVQFSWKKDLKAFEKQLFSLGYPLKPITAFRDPPLVFWAPPLPQFEPFFDSQIEKSLPARRRAARRKDEDLRSWLLE